MPRTLRLSALGAALFFAAPALAQPAPKAVAAEAREAVGGIGQDGKAFGSGLGQAARETGQAIGQGARSAAQEVSKGFRRDFIEGGAFKGGSRGTAPKPSVGEAP